MDLKNYMQKACRQVDEKLNELLPGDDTRPLELHRAMRYSVLDGGKRIRAVLCLAACESLGGDRAAALPAAAALELLHAYTLVHDDLPAMDDDDLRRGKPSCHKAFGEAEAILAGDALLTLAFEVLAESEMPGGESAARLVGELARAAGSRGVVGGQYEDIKAGDALDDASTLDFIQTHKTADLISCACRLGAIVAGADSAQLAALDKYGLNIGLAFQIIDDILDQTGEQALLGKPIGSDLAKHKMTSVSLYGLDGAREKAHSLVREAQAALTSLPGSIAALQQVAELVIERDR
jgi:geranylgeranyl diphosphate synthase, type II